MLNIEFSINFFAFIFIVVIAVLAGYSFRSKQIKKKQSKIQDLRKEIVWNHAQILELQKEYVALESQLKVTQAPVLPLNMQVIDYLEETKKVSDGFM